MCQKITRVVSSEPQGIAAAQIDAADQIVAMFQWNHRDTFQTIGIRADHLMVASCEGAQPGLMQGDVLWSQTGKRLDHQQMAEVFDRRAIRHQQMSNIVIRIAQLNADVFKTVANSQAIDQNTEQCIEIF